MASCVGSKHSQVLWNSLFNSEFNCISQNIAPFIQLYNEHFLKLGRNFIKATVFRLNREVLVCNILPWMSKPNVPTKFIWKILMASHLPLVNWLTNCIFDKCKICYHNFGLFHILSLLPGLNLNSIWCCIISDNASHSHAHVTQSFIHHMFNCSELLYLQVYTNQRTRLKCPYHSEHYTDLYVCTTI